MLMRSQMVLSAGLIVLVASPSHAAWQYHKQVDEMRNRTVETAILKSGNAPNLKSPYQGGSPVYLTVARVSEFSIIFFELTRGQFDCYECQITVKVDDELMTFGGSISDCGEHKCLNVSVKLLDKLLTAKTLIAELPIYGFGAYQYRFDLAGYPLQ
jgi:hypothetical protein